MPICFWLFSCAPDLSWLATVRSGGGLAYLKVDGPGVFSAAF